MNITTLHSAYACSSLIMGDFGEISLTGDASHSAIMTASKTLENFIEKIICCIVYNEKSFKQGYVNSPWRKYAHIIASTSHNQPMTEKYLREIGFTPSKPVKQTKNKNQIITIWTMEIPEFFKKIEELAEEFGISMETGEKIKEKKDA